MTTFPLAADTIPALRPSQAITVFGLSRSGVGAAILLKESGFTPFLSEAKALEPNHTPFVEVLESHNLPFETGAHSERAFQCDLAVLSPGIPPDSGLVKRLLADKTPFISEVQLAQLLAKNAAGFIGITGTNGKTTVTALIEWLLNQGGKAAVACGNIGKAASEVIAQENAKPSSEARLMVMELSSYQLAYSPDLSLDVAVLTNLGADHISWHGSQQAYAEAKLSMFRHAKAPAWVVLPLSDPKTAGLLKSLPQSTKVALFTDKTPEQWPDRCTLGLWLDEASEALMGQLFKEAPDVALPEGQPQPLLSLRDLPLKGRHNQLNALTGLAVGLAYGLSRVALARALMAFKGVPHRLEFVAELPAGKRGIAVYNDSKATNPEASIEAIKAFPDNPVVLLAGGVDKGTELRDWARLCVQQQVRVITYGMSKPRLNHALKEAGCQTLSSTGIMKEAWENALKQCQALAAEQPERQPVLLLSPACASFDEFSDFEDRGDQFKRWVLAASEVASAMNPPASMDVAR